MYGSLIIYGADLDEDHRLDIAYAKSNRLSIELFLGYGNNSFEKHREYVHKTLEDREHMNVLFAADLNYDHHLDFIFTYFPQDKINIAYGFGNGSFQDRTVILGIDLPPVALFQMAYLNNDTYFDLAIGPTSENEILVRLGRREGGFSILPDHRMHIRFYRSLFVLADMNTDGILDLVYGADEARFMIHLGVGDGSFHRGQIHSTPLSTPLEQIIPCDLNEDGLLDLVIYHCMKTKLYVMLNDGSRTFDNIASDYIDNIDIDSIKISDMNHDNHLDIVAIQEHPNNSIKIYYGFGNGSFTTAEIITVSKHHDVDSFEVGDFNGDHLLDLVMGVDGQLIFVLNDC